MKLTGICQFMALTIFAIAVPASATETGCRQNDFLALESYFLQTEVHKNVEFLMEIGADGTRQLKKIHELRQRGDCWAQVVRLHPQAPQILSQFEAHVETPLNDEYGVAEDKCSPWVDERLANEIKIPQFKHWCFAHVVADALVNETGEQIVPWELAAIYSSNPNSAEPYIRLDVKNDRLALGGFPPSVITELTSSDRGLCLRENFNLGTGDEVEKYSQKMNLLIEQISTIQEPDKITQILQDNQSLFKNIKVKDINDIAQMPRKLDRLKELFVRNCKLRTNPISVTTSLTNHRYDAYDKAMLGNRLDHVLNSGRPAVISYWAKRFGGPFLESGIKTKPRFRNGESEISDHVSTVIGRRFKNNRCEYLIKDSNNVDCRYIADSFDCDERNGNFWAPRTTLVNSMLTVGGLSTGFKPRSLSETETAR